MIVAFASSKGGVGKSTLAVNTAIVRSLAGRDVLLVDGDTQGSAADFTALRLSLTGKDGYTVVRHYGSELRDQVRKQAPKYDDTIIDVGGRDGGGIESNSLRAALLVAETVVVPVLPRTLDVWATGQMGERVREARVFNEKLRAISLLNMADAAGKDNGEAAEAIDEIEGIDCIGLTIGRRKAFPTALSSGLSVVEQQRGDQKAIAELRALMSAIYGESN